MAIAIGIDGLAHTTISVGIVQKGADLGDDEVVVGANEVDGARLQGLGAFGGVVHHQYWLAKAGGLFLNATRIGEDNGGLLHEINELQVLQGLDEEEVRSRQIFAKDLVNGLAHIGIEVHGVDEVDIGVLLVEVFHGGDHGDEAFAEVLTAMAGNQYQFFLSRRNSRKNRKAFR